MAESVKFFISLFLFQKDTVGRYLLNRKRYLCVEIFIVVQESQRYIASCPIVNKLNTLTNKLLKKQVHLWSGLFNRTIQF
jgi:hypothetical protein